MSCAYGRRHWCVVNLQKIHHGGSRHYNVHVFKFLESFGRSWGCWRLIQKPKSWNSLHATHLVEKMDGKDWKTWMANLWNMFHMLWYEWPNLGSWCNEKTINPPIVTTKSVNQKDKSLVNFKILLHMKRMYRMT
jgi:hypothetical protein